MPEAEDTPPETTTTAPTSLADSIAAVIAERFSQRRRAEGWTLPEIAKRCASEGSPELTESSLANILRPKNRRRVTVDQWLTLARVFGDPPGLWLMPIKTPHEITLFEGKVFDPWNVIRWISGEATLDGQSTDTDPGAAPVVLRRRHDRHVAEYLAAMTELQTPWTPELVKRDSGEWDYRASPNKSATAGRAAAAVLAIRADRAEMRRLGLTPPPLTEEQGLRTAVGDEAGDG